MANQDLNDPSRQSTVETVRRVETTVDDSRYQESTDQKARAERSERQMIATRIVWLVDGILLILLAFRFVLALLGADPANAFANFIYSVSYPFVAPFFGLFGYHYTYGVSQLEVFTLVAMAVYAVVAWIIDKAINITRTNV